MKHKIQAGVKKFLFSGGPRQVAEPEKELRFTRLVQAMKFYILAIVCFAVSIVALIFAVQDGGVEDRLLNVWLCFSITMAILAFFCIRIGLHCTRHAYLILNPLGIEIFPFFRPRRNFRLIYWSDVEDVEFTADGKQLLLHFNKEKSGGVVIALAPLAKTQQHFLQHAVIGVMQKRQSP